MFHSRNSFQDLVPMKAARGNRDGRGGREAEKRRVEVVQEQLKAEERSRTEAEKRGVEAQSVIALSGGPVDDLFAEMGIAA